MARRTRRNRPRRGGRGGRRGQGSQRNLMSFAIGVGAVLLAGLVIVVVVQAALSSGGGGDFEFEVYQGTEALGGTNVSLSDVVGQGKPVVLNFFAGDCPPCRAELPAFQKVYEEQKDDVLFLGMDVGVFTGLGTRSSALSLLNELRVTYPAGAPPDRGAVVAYNILSMPTTVFFDAKGNISSRSDGAINEFRLNNSIADALESS